MTIIEAIAQWRRFFLDSAPVIYFIEQNPTYFTRVEPLFRGLDQGVLSAVSSPITLAESLVMPLRQGNQQAQADFVALLTTGPSMTFSPVEAKIAALAATLRNQYRLRLPDALQVANGILSQCDAFLTNDKTLKRIKEIPILVIDDLDP